jgi:hypothetical protein
VTGCESLVTLSMLHAVGRSTSAGGVCVQVQAGGWLTKAAAVAHRQCCWVGVAKEVQQGRQLGQLAGTAGQRKTTTRQGDPVSVTG